MEKFTPNLCEYDSVLDVQEVDQFGYIDLRQAYLTGTVEGSLAPSDESYNGVDDPSTLLSSPKDTFEAIRQAEAVAKAKSAKSAAAKAKSAKSAAAKADAPTEGGAASSAAAE